MAQDSGEPVSQAELAGSPVLLADTPAAAATRQRGSMPLAPGELRWLALPFLAPALVLLAAILLYPLIYSIVRSLFADGAPGGFGSFVGLRNYGSIFTDSSTLRAVENNLLWLVVVPTIVTILGLIFAVLTERIRWATAFKTVLFMPMAISALASGITFALIYADQPSRGLANAVTVGIHDAFGSSSAYPTVFSNDAAVYSGSALAGYTTKTTFAPGSAALLPLTGLNLQSPPPDASQAALPPVSRAVYGVIWNDFRLGGGGTAGKIDPRELGLPGMQVQAIRGSQVVATTTADAHGGFVFPGLTSGRYQLRLPAANFAAAFGGVSWLGPNLITPAIMIAYLWIYAGFAMVLLAAGMAAIPRDALEAARMDGATERQVFRRITVPLLAPVLTVVFVTLIINVPKVFDIVFIIGQSAGANQKYSDVLAVSLYSAFGNQQYGLASAIGVILVLAVIPMMVVNIRRFRREQR